MGTRPTFTWGIKRRSLKKRTLCGTRFTVRQLHGGITLYVGQLVIDLYDAATEALVWRGAVSKTINRTAKPEKRQKNLEKAIAKLLKNYPSKTKA